jgi:hypothetical protein
MFTRPDPKTFEVIYSHDPAIDTDSKQYDAEKYFDTRDEQYLPMKNGGTPVRYQFRRLRGTGYAQLLAWMNTNSDDHIGALFEMVVRSLESMDGAEFDDGTPIKVGHLFDKQQRHRRLNEDTIETLMAADEGVRIAGKPSLIAELGLAISKEIFGGPLS